MREITLAIIQGLTEFLPVSSSGHLVLTQKVLKTNPSGIGLEVFLHLSTALAILVFFGGKIIPFYRKYFREVIICIIPAGITGILFKGTFETFFDNPEFLGFFFILNGIILFFAHERKPPLSLSPLKALFIGIFQVFALFPGISRSGITISTGLFLSIKKKTSFEFSFLMGLPLILGSGLVEANNILLSLPNILAFIIAFLTGLLALYLLKKILFLHKFHLFGIYTVILGILSFIL